jgi:septum site-determining protein MinC
MSKPPPAVNPRSRPSPVRFRGRSFMALVLAPRAPLEQWLGEIDSTLDRSPGFFTGRAVILDVSALQIDRAELSSLIRELHAREIRILGIEGADSSTLSLGLPPPLSGGRPAGIIEVHDVPRAPPPPPPPSQMPLVIDGSVRSGQSILHLEGDVTVLGSVASGSEIVCSGSIHVYGALRGRAIAGSTGNAQARIFCRKHEAELLAIDGLYRTADDLGPLHRGLPIQVSLDGDALIVKPLD